MLHHIAHLEIEDHVKVSLVQVLILNSYWTTDVLIFNVLNMDRKTGEIGPMNGISLSDIHMDL